MQDLCLIDLQSFENDPDPRIQDLRLAELLGFGQIHDIRKLIERNQVELERYGTIRHRGVSRPQGGGRESFEFWLNEGQALLVCVKSETERAADVREQVIKRYMEWRVGRLAPPPAPTDPFEVLELFFANYKETKREVGHLKARADDHDTRIKHLEDYRPSGRQKDRHHVTPLIKAQHVEATRLLGGRCPCCGVVEVVDRDGVKVEGAEFDHFNDRTDARLEATWLICFDCNRRRLDKAYSPERQLAFGHYQQKLKNLEGRLKNATNVVALPLRPPVSETAQPQPELTDESVDRRSEGSVKLFTNGAGDLGGRIGSISARDVEKRLGYLPENLAGCALIHLITSERLHLSARAKPCKSDSNRYYLTAEHKIPDHWLLDSGRKRVEYGIYDLVKLEG